MRCAALTIAFLSTVVAQDTSGTGSLRGRLQPPAALEVCLLKGACEQADPAGMFRFSALRPGRYVLVVNGRETQVGVRAGLETELIVAIADTRQSIEVTASSTVAPQEARSSVHLIEVSADAESTLLRR